MADLNHLKNKRIAGIDYGKKRIGVSVCDIMHITVSPKLIVENNESTLSVILDFVSKEDVHSLVVGVPYREDDKNNDFINEILDFIEQLKKTTGLDVYEQDESFSTIDAVNTMIDIGYSRKKRKNKGNKDRIASAIILRNFLNTID